MGLVGGHGLGGVLFGPLDFGAVIGGCPAGYGGVERFGWGDVLERNDLVGRVCQVTRALLRSLPPMVLVRVASALCPSCGKEQVWLLWVMATSQP